MNPVPSDAADLPVMSGLRLGVSGATTRGFGIAEFHVVGDLITEALEALARQGGDAGGGSSVAGGTGHADSRLAQTGHSVLQRVRAITARFPIYT